MDEFDDDLEDPADIEKESIEELTEKCRIYDLIYDMKRRHKDVVANLRGHFGYLTGEEHKKFVERLMSDLMDCVYGNSKESIEAVAKASKSGKAASCKVFFRPMYPCHVCDDKVIFSFDGINLVADSDCAFPNGMPEYSIDLSVPSGKLVIANDLRDLFENEYEEEDLRPCSRGFGFNLNSDMGCRQVFEAYGKLGMAHGFVGNTCPGVYRINEDALTISRIKYDEDLNDEDDPLPGERVAGICTDLWWYSIVDYDDYVRRTGEKPNEWCSIVEVKPGTYRVTHRYHLLDRDANTTDHYAIIERIGADTGLKEIREREIESVEDVIKADIIFGVGKVNRGVALNNLFFVIGSSDRWHKGCIVGAMSSRKLLDRLKFSKTKVPDDLEERLKNTKMDSIYPLSEGYSKIFSVPDDVQPDWLLAAFEAIDIALALDPKAKSSVGYKNSDMIKLAKKAKRQLEKRFGKRDEIISKHSQIS